MAGRPPPAGKLCTSANPVPPRRKTSSGRAGPERCNTPVEGTACALVPFDSMRCRSVDASKPMSSMAEQSCSGEVLAMSKTTMAFSCMSKISARSTPSTASSAFSTEPEHTVHVMPPTASSAKPRPCDLVAWPPPATRLSSELSAWPPDTGSLPAVARLLHRPRPTPALNKLSGLNGSASATLAASKSFKATCDMSLASKPTSSTASRSSAPESFAGSKSMKARSSLSTTSALCTPSSAIRAFSTVCLQAIHFIPVTDRSARSIPSTSSDGTAPPMPGIFPAAVGLLLLPTTSLTLQQSVLPNC
mmetsp:Transcript_51013/g.148532  ORF Transcript_51013/g.148532 Transcript_51013/m.148532 type:complete len:304 (+) Transcript_51013:44-955(+)